MHVSNTESFFVTGHQDIIKYWSNNTKECVFEFLPSQLQKSTVTYVKPVCGEYLENLWCVHKNNFRF